MLLPFFAAFQLASSAPPRVYDGRAGQTTVAIPKIEADVDIDGNLDEAVWRQAAVLTGFSLYQPFDQRPAPDSTEVLVWYSSNAIYFGIRAFEPHGQVTATLADRDRIGSDDNVEIHLDTFDERNRAFVFLVNPFGVQADGTKNETGGFIPGANVMPGQNDLSADFIWQSRGRLIEGGYVVEVRIPFGSLRYPLLAEQRWGLQIDRHVQHNGYEETWTPALKASATFIGQAGWITGLTGLHHGQLIELNPELTNTVNGSPCCATPQTGWRYQSNPRLGGNLRWTLGSNFILNGTVKPDFSQVEADATQIAADARFALFYPEKRPFFVEGSGQFNVPNTLVYTRTIVQPDAAAKLTGKLGRADVAILSAFDQPSFASHDRPLVDIVRLQQNFGEQSLAGLVYSDRVGSGRENRLLGGDTHIVFGKIYFAQFQAVQSMTRMNGVSQSGPLWEAVVDATGRSWGFHYNILGIAPEFQSDNGFIPRVGYVSPSAANRVTLYGKPGGLFEQLNVYFQASGLWKYNDFFDAKSVLEDRFGATGSVRLRGGWNVNFSPKIATYAFDPARYAGVYLRPSIPFQPSDR
ncbi:MAG TPA: carbohydrate binding family 9 domain-containing protein, partial [Gemmatimonadaceae bacterium]